MIAAILSFIAALQWRQVVVFAALGLAIGLGNFTYGYFKGRASAQADCQARALRVALDAEKAKSEDLEKQIAARDEIARRDRARAVDATLDAERAIAQAEALRRHLETLQPGKVCLDAETARHLDRIGR